MHLISELEIINFKSCKNLKIKLEGFSPLVGYNNAGKTNILKAIDTLVKGKAIGEDSFNDLTQPLIIIAVLTGLNDEVLSHLSAPQKASLQPYIENGCIHIQFRQEGIGKTALTLGVRGGRSKFCVRSISYKLMCLSKRPGKWIAICDNVKFQFCTG